MRSPLAYIRSHGILGTLRALADYGGHLRRRWINSSIDRKYGTDTQGVIDDMSALGLSSAQHAHAKGYEGVQIPVFREMLRQLPLISNEYIFLDLGSGKGRALMMAAEHGFKRVIGVELSPTLHQIAEKNIELFKQHRPQASPIELRCQDAVDYRLPDDKLVCFFYNPFDCGVMQQLLLHIKESHARCPRSIVVAYRNPVCADLFDKAGFLRLIHATPAYRLYATK